MSFKNELAKKAIELGAMVREESDRHVLSESITHVISPPSIRTIKTLTAALTKRFVISPKWITDSYSDYVAKNKTEEAKGFLDPEKYGFHRSEDILVGKRVYITDAFQSPAYASKLDHLKNLIEKIGGGRIIEEPTSCDIIISDPSETDEYSQKAPKVLTWDSFINWICPLSDLQEAAQASLSARTSSGEQESKREQEGSGAAPEEEDGPKKKSKRKK